jgi:hypothetical protein
MFDPVWRTVTGRQDPSDPGRLNGYAIYRVRGETYPGIVPSDGSDALVNGCVYWDLDGPTVERLDRFEGEFYRRIPVSVDVMGGRPAACEAYVVRPSFTHILSRKPWSAQWFETHGLQAFLSSYKGFRSL